MAFCTFSKEFSANMFTSVENQFITKYLPQADGDAVRAYLYGLYLCQCADEFDAAACAKLLRIDQKRLVDIFEFWEECDLVHILSREPLYLQYLPVNAAIGKPKTVRAEKYAEFNRELFKLMQKAQKMLKPYEQQRILEFLENTPMEQQAFLLVTEYCIRKDGDKLSCSHILNKAKKLAEEHKFTYEQVEHELADFNAHEKEISRIFTLLGIYRKPQESDYDYIDRWSAFGTDIRAVYECAKMLKKGSLSTLDQLVTELHEKDVHALSEAKTYLARREELSSLVFKIARKLGVKVENPRPFSDSYAEKWTERGYDEASLVSVAALCFKFRYGFAEMDSMLDSLYAQGVVDGQGVSEFCAEREGQFRVLQKIQNVCGMIKKTGSALDMVASWREWNFSDEMILEAAKRSASASAPLSYMNKLLSEWKRAGAFTVKAIPEAAVNALPPAGYRSEATVAADKRADREHYYAVLRQRAIAKAERAAETADRDETFRAADTALKKGEIDLARAEVFAPDTVAEINARLEEQRRRRASALSRLGLTEADLTPRFACPKCSDTGFLPDGKPCDCYHPE